LLKAIKRKLRFFSIADYLLVHNENSKEELKITYNITDNILIHPFPLTDIKQLGFKKKVVDKKDIYSVGMFGHFRKEKGLDILIKAWLLLRSTDNDIKLILGGNFPENSKLLLNKIDNDKNVLIVKSYLSDNLLFDLMQQCDIVILPYKRTTNTAFPYMILSIDKLVIASDVPTFKDNPLFTEMFLFKRNDPLSLMQTIKAIKNMNDAEIDKIKQDNKQKMKKYKKQFDDEIFAVYHSILCQT
jgi:glycosyltransferase involved in cell wall biosynthesis